MDITKLYLDDRQISKFFLQLTKDNRLNIIGRNYREKVIRRGRRYNRHNKFFLKNKILKAIKKQHYYMRKNKVQECDVIMIKRARDGTQKISKTIKTFEYNRYDLIAFIGTITIGDPIINEFIKIPDVKFVLKQLSIYGIENIIEFCS